MEKYPSGTVKGFCDNLKKLIEVRAGKLLAEDICECEIDSIISHYLKDDAQKTNLANGLFWVIWIQNTIEKVADKELYEQFKSIYPFPRLFSHKGGYASPFSILQPYRLYPQPNKELLLSGGTDIWGEVASWLDSIGHQDVMQAVIKSFEEDLRKCRFPVNLSSLWRP